MLVSNECNEVTAVGINEAFDIHVAVIREKLVDFDSLLLDPAVLKCCSHSLESRDILLDKGCAVCDVGSDNHSSKLSKKIVHIHNKKFRAKSYNRGSFELDTKNSFDCLRSPDDLGGKSVISQDLVTDRGFSNDCFLRITDR